MTTNYFPTLEIPLELQLKLSELIVAEPVGAYVAVGEATQTLIDAFTPESSDVGDWALAYNTGGGLGWSRVGPGLAASAGDAVRAHAWFSALFSGAVRAERGSLVLTLPFEMDPTQAISITLTSINGLVHTPSLDSLSTIGILLDFPVDFNGDNVTVVVDYFTANAIDP